MTSDRELLELAAKAAGIDLSGGVDEHGAYEENWNPLIDDGDALRLAVNLNLCIEVNPTHTRCFLNGVYKPISLSDEGDDSMTQTRRAIVRAAASIGESM